MMRNLWIYLLLALAALLIVACGAGAEPAKPTVRITGPASGSQVETGQNVLVTFEAADVKGVSQIELAVNGQPTYVETASPPVNVFSGSYNWQPETPGTYLIQIITFNVDGVASDPVQIALTAGGEPVAQASPAEEPATEPTEAISPTEALPTATPTRPLTPPTPAGGEATSDGTETTTGPVVTFKTNLNVRGGPGTNYPVIGRAAEGDTALITGRTDLSTWWQIAFSSESGDRGWVSADEQFTSASNTGDVPVVQAPPPPAATEPPPDSGRPVIHSFTADQTSILLGQNTILRWDLENAREAYLRYEGKEEGIVSPGSKTVSPDEDTTYTLVARNDNGETTAEVTIRVGSATATPARVLLDGKTNIIDGQTIDFDRGVVQGSDGAGADFLWDLAAREFRPRNGAAGVLINKPFGDITLADCQAAAYGAPIDEVDGSSPIQGCYRTSEGRFGKFAVSNWDITGRLTIDWVTWES